MEIDHTLDFLWVYRVMPGTSNGETLAEGGEIPLDGEIRDLFESAFRGDTSRRLKPQPFHLDFQGTDRAHPVRDAVAALLGTEDSQRRAACERLAHSLSSSIDNRTGELLLSIGVGKAGSKAKCAIWAYPSDDSIQFRTANGVPEVREIEDAFSKSSDARKAAFFEEDVPLGRNSLLRGLLIDRTANRYKGSSDYWLRDFLNASIELYPARGTAILLSNLNSAQKAAHTLEEKASVRSVYDRVRAGNMRPTSLRAIGASLVGEARIAYNKKLPKTEEADANFDLDPTTVNSKLKNTVLTLESGITVILPIDNGVDVTDYVVERNGERYVVIDELVVDESYR